MDYDQLGGQGGGKAGSQAGASLFNTSGKGEREWRSATDGSVITSSAKVGIAVAQQRAPPDNTPSYFSNHSQSSGGGSSSMIGGTSIAGAAAANSAAAAATLVAGQTALDLNSFQQLYSQAVAGLPLSVPAANLQPAIPFPVAYWPPMQIPTAAAAVQYQALGNILRSSSSAAALSGAAAAAAGYPASLLQPTTLAAALGAALPPASTSSNLEPLLAAAAASNSQIRSTDWNDNPLLVVSSGSLQSSDLSNLSSINTTPALLQHTINSVSGGSVVPELGKVYAYPRKQCDLSAESPHAASGMTGSDMGTSVGSTSSFGKTIGFVRKPKPFAENTSVFTNRESIKSDAAPKINLPTRSLTIPTSSYHSRSNSPQSPSTPTVVHQQVSKGFLFCEVNSFANSNVCQQQKLRLG